MLWGLREIINIAQFVSGDLPCKRRVFFIDNRKSLVVMTHFLLFCLENALFVYIF